MRIAKTGIWNMVTQRTKNGHKDFNMSFVSVPERVGDVCGIGASKRENQWTGYEIDRRSFYR